MDLIRRIWPIRRAADPADVAEFRIQGLPHVHRVEAGSPLKDARDRGAVVLFEAEDLGSYRCGIARQDDRPIAHICGWTSYSKGFVSDVDGNVRETRVAVAWGWPIKDGEKADG